MSRAKGIGPETPTRIRKSRTQCNNRARRDAPGGRRADDGDAAEAAEPDAGRTPRTDRNRKV